MSCNVGEVTERLKQPCRHFTYVTVHSPTLPSFYLRHSSCSNPSVASPTSQLILQPFFRFSYITGSSFTPPSESPMDHGYSHRATSNYIDWLQRRRYIHIRGVSYISVIIVTDDYLCYKKPKSPCNFFLILIFNELFTFKISDEW